MNSFCFTTTYTTEKEKKQRDMVLAKSLQMGQVNAISACVDKFCHDSSGIIKIEALFIACLKIFKRNSISFV